LRNRTDLRGCAVWCCHCGIRFFTHPRNAGRQDLRCPFGCRQTRRKQRSNERSKTHYRTEAGKEKKRLLNQRRSFVEFRSEGDATRSDDDQVDDDEPASHDPGGQAGYVRSYSCRNRQGLRNVTSSDHPLIAAQGKTPPVRVEQTFALELDGLVVDEACVIKSRLLPYLCMVASVIERRAIGREELVTALRKRMRQRSIDRRSRLEYVLWSLNEHPPWEP